MTLLVLPPHNPPAGAGEPSCIADCLAGPSRPSVLRALAWLVGVPSVLGDEEAATVLIHPCVVENTKPPSVNDPVVMTFFFPSK
jgi:hypothetical protein